MNDAMRHTISVISITVLSLLLGCSFTHAPAPKINGVCLEMPPDPVGNDKMAEVRRINAGWVGLIPYAFSRGHTPTVHHGYSNQWWGEGIEGMKACIKMAKAEGLKVMVKPHVWVTGDGWPGYFDLDTEQDWKVWEETYSDYIMTYARLANAMKAELFVIGTEYRIAAVKRPEFWKNLIQKVRKVYSGQVTYAANWDNYQKISFWEELDFIGIDAYFPLTQGATPTLAELKKGWETLSPELEAFAQKHDKQILFTEYGFRSVDYATSRHWKYDKKQLKPNNDLQARAYRALYETVWQKAWLSGGFLWKWHVRSGFDSRQAVKKFTPQDKPAEKVIAKWYGSRGDGYE